MKKKKCVITYNDIKNINCDIPGWFDRFVKDKLRKAGFKNTDSYTWYEDIAHDRIVIEEFKPC